MVSPYNLKAWVEENRHHDASFQLEDLASQLKPIIESFYADESVRTCKSCHAVMEPPSASA